MKLVFEEVKMRRLVNPHVLKMLEALEIDYLGVSIDALLIIAPEEESRNIARTIEEAGVSIDIVGRVEKGSGAELHIGDIATDFTP